MFGSLIASPIKVPDEALILARGFRQAYGEHASRAAQELSAGVAPGERRLIEHAIIILEAPPQQSRVQRYLDELRKWLFPRRPSCIDEPTAKADQRP